MECCHDLLPLEGVKGSSCLLRIFLDIGFVVLSACGSGLVLGVLVTAGLTISFGFTLTININFIIARHERDLGNAHNVSLFHGSLQTPTEWTG